MKSSNESAIRHTNRRIVRSPLPLVPDHKNECRAQRIQNPKQEDDNNGFGQHQVSIINMAEKVLSSCKPSIGITLVLLPLVLLFAGLGTWQLHRATQKTVLEQQFLVAQSMPLAEALQGDNRFAQVQADGHYDTQRHVLLDNQVWHGHAGVYVFTPFYLPGGSAILVNRGLAADAT